MSQFPVLASASDLPPIVDVGVKIPFVNWLGVRFHQSPPRTSLISLDPHEHHVNSFGMVHGGVVMTLLDVSMAMAARADPDQTQDVRGMVTIEMKTSFLAPSRGLIRAFGELTKATATLAFCETSLVNLQGDLLARASGTFKYMRPRPGV
jgi:uncharacterized protein (TIGR00369 family)